MSVTLIPALVARQGQVTSMPNVSVDEIEITPEMIDAGEAILSSLFEGVDSPSYYSVISAAKDVYIAMASTRRVSLISDSHIPAVEITSEMIDASAMVLWLCLDCTQSAAEIVAGDMLRAAFCPPAL